MQKTLPLDLRSHMNHVAHEARACSCGQRGTYFCRHVREAVGLQCSSGAGCPAKHRPKGAGQGSLSACQAGGCSPVGGDIFCSRVRIWEPWWLVWHREDAYGWRSCKGDGVVCSTASRHTVPIKEPLAASALLSSPVKVEPLIGIKKKKRKKLKITKWWNTDTAHFAFACPLQRCFGSSNSSSFLLLEFKTKHHHQKLWHAPACTVTALHVLGHERRDL